MVIEAVSGPIHRTFGVDADISGSTVSLSALDTIDPQGSINAATLVQLDTSNGSINFGVIDGIPEVVAPALDISTQNGVNLEIDVNNLTINNTVSGNVTIVATGGSLSADSVLNPGRPVSVETQQGPLAIGVIDGSVVTLMPGTGSGLRAITDANGSTLNISATTLNFSALDGFGTFVDPIETNIINPFSVDTAFGDIGIIQSGNLKLLGDPNTTGSIWLGASGGELLIQDQTISGNTIILSGSTVKVEALLASTQVNAGADLEVVNTGSLTVQGSNTNVSAFAKLVAGSGITINAGDVSVIGGDADFATASIDPVALLMNLSGDLIIVGGAGNMSESQLAADSLILNVLGNINLLGGAGDSAFATINAFNGDVFITAGTVLLPGDVIADPGTGSNADAVFLANAGLGQVDIAAGSCNVCTVLGSDPFLDPASQAGIFGNYTFTLLELPPPPPLPPPPVSQEMEPPTALPDDDTLNFGTDQVIVLNEYQDNVVVAVVNHDPDDEDEDERERVCR